MLSRSFRLTRSFEIIFKKGAKISTPFFVMRAIPALDGKNRLAVIVSKKTEKSAVRRNRIRRRLLEAVKKNDFPESQENPFRFVIIGFSPALRANFEGMTKEMKKSFEKIQGSISKK